MSGAIVYFVPHIPKCGGSTIYDFFFNALGPEQAAFIYTRAERRQWRRSRGIPAPIRDRLRLMGGHRLNRSMMERFPDREIRECIIIREPVGFVVSMYNFLRHQPRKQSGIGDTPFETWYRRYGRNRISRFLLKEYLGLTSLEYRLMPAKARLARIAALLDEAWFVGTSADVDPLIAHLAREFGYDAPARPRNVARPGSLKVSDLDPAMRERIERDNALDLEIYRHVVEHARKPVMPPDARATTAAEPAIP